MNAPRIGAFAAADAPERVDAVAVINISARLATIRERIEYRLLGAVMRRTVLRAHSQTHRALVRW